MTGDSRDPQHITGEAPPSSAPLDAVAHALRGLRYGKIVIQVHDGRVVQIERTEKVRPGGKPPR